MGIKAFYVERKIREKLGNGRRSYNIFAGILLMLMGGTNLLEKGFSNYNSSTIINMAIILLSLLMLVFGIIGKEPIKTKYRLKIDNDYLTTKKTFETETKIKLSSITGVKFISQKLEATYNDYIKTYDFSWLSENEYDSLKTWLKEYCKEKERTIL